MRIPHPTAACIAAAFLLAGCQVGERNEGDADGDFLEDALENGGWNITVQFDVPECFVPGAAAPEVSVAVSSHSYETDSDQDGLEDLLEYTIGSNPLKEDTDGDGLTDSEENDLARGDTLRFPGSLSLNRADSDADCIGDRDELDGFDVPGIGHRATDPTARDTDGDGLSDPDEVFRVHSDPRSTDTDGDGANDRFDVQPLKNLGLDLRFDSVRPKQNVGTGNVRFIYAIPTGGGQSQSDPEGSGFAAPQNQDTAVPANVGPGVVDADDSSADGLLHIDVLGLINEASTRTAGCGGAYDIVPGSDECIGVVRIDWRNATWSLQGQTVYPADGSAITIETPDVRLVVRLSVVEL